jgi:hypothetical protein
MSRFSQVLFPSVLLAAISVSNVALSQTTLVDAIKNGMPLVDLPPAL